ncbi:hypothetical protein ABZ815_39850 [Nonomuraea sp. NPDC047529]|uniref:hypothetical protein n=1 Tax=Nonomuraea sp. NPDC047529 TaxID=3155623 RepID=UPI0033E389CB
MSARDTLAEVDDARLPEVAQKWLNEHPFGLDDEHALDLVRELVALARRAKESDRLLYCWWIPG